MSTTTRWVEYSTTAIGAAGLGGTAGLGTRGKAAAGGASDKDTFDIGAGQNTLKVSLDSVEKIITLTSGTNLDPRFVARNITEKLHNIDVGNISYDHAQCVWENGQLVLYTGKLGSGTSVVVSSGTSTAHLELGWGTCTPDNGDAADNLYDGGISVSGTYNGFFDETYKVVVNLENPIQNPVRGPSNGSTSPITAGGAYNYKATPANIEYTLYIDVSTGNMMGGGQGWVPKMSWESTPNLDDGGPVELLYQDYWYNVGIYGLMVKFGEGTFTSCPPGGVHAWTIQCDYSQWAWSGNAQGAVGNAMYIYGSNRGDDATSAITSATDDSNQLGTRGLYLKFEGTNNLRAGDEFYIVCKAPAPSSTDVGITNVNYGNVTVSTESAVKCVMFEIMSGAVEISTVKFGLQSHGSFEHHNEVNGDTYFRFGTVGPGNPAGSFPVDGIEWHQNVVHGDLSDSGDSPPAHLHAIDHSLAVVSDADDCEEVGKSGYMGMTTDPIFINIRLGASEVGSNSTINQRIFFDYS